MSNQNNLAKFAGTFDSDFFDSTILVNGRIVGEIILLPRRYIALSKSFPAVSLTRIDDYVDLSSSVAPDFHSVMRSEYIEVEDDASTFHDEFEVSSVSGSDIILTDTVENNRILSDLYEDALVHGGGLATPSYTNWIPVTGDNGVDYAITGINTGTRTITVSGSPASFSYVKFSQYRIAGDITKVRVYSQRGRAITGTRSSAGLLSGLRRRDQMQRITGEFSQGTASLYTLGGLTLITGASSQANRLFADSNPSTSRVGLDSSASPNARTSTNTDDSQATHGPEFGVEIYQWLGRYLG